jgi:hypothetical protein
MKKIFLIFAFTVLIMGCKENNKINEIYDTSLVFSLIDQNKKDLLDIDHPNHILESDIELTYYMQSDFQNPQTNRKVKFANEKKENLFILHLELNETSNYERPITLVKWGDLRTDTLRASFGRSDNGIRIGTAWLNDKLIFDVSDRDLENGWYQVLKFDTK